MNRGWALALLLLWGGCGDGETTLSPLDAGGDASLDGGLPDAAQDASPPKVRRTVMQRNPFGNVAATQNLLWDGDFEWSSPFSGQYGWVDAVYFSPTGNFSQIRVGPMCRSGLKCGYMTQSQRVAAIGVSPSGTKVSASVWVKVPTNDCGDMGVHLFACDFAKDPDLPMSDPDGPDADGWSAHDAAVLRAVDELLDDACIADATWATLAEALDPQQLLDLIFTVGAYDALAMMMRSFGVPLDADLAGVTPLPPAP